MWLSCDSRSKHGSRTVADSSQSRRTCDHRLNAALQPGGTILDDHKRQFYFTDSALLQAVGDTIRNVFSQDGFSNFRSVWAFIATWHNVSNYGFSTQTIVSIINAHRRECGKNPLIKLPLNYTNWKYPKLFLDTLFLRFFSIRNREINAFYFRDFEHCTSQSRGQANVKGLTVGPTLWLRLELQL